MALNRDSRVLIADADPGLRRGLSNRLTDSAISVDCVADGKSALEELAARPCSVVVLDLTLPQVGAERVLTSIAEMPVAARPVVLVLASNGAARSLDVDVVQIVLRKPCDLTQLSDIVQNCVRSNVLRPAVQP